MKGDIDRIMGDIDLEMTPVLPLPSKLVQELVEATGDGGGKGRGGQTQAPEWWSKNSSVNPHWKLPERKAIADFFDRGNQTGLANRALMPRVKHHHPRVPGLRGVCMKYQDGSCVPHCGLAHVPLKEMNKELRTDLDKAVAKIYQRKTS